MESERRKPEPGNHSSHAGRYTTEQIRTRTHPLPILYKSYGFVTEGTECRERAKQSDGQEPAKFGSHCRCVKNSDRKSQGERTDQIHHERTPRK
jgi:hypothetical protein